MLTDLFTPISRWICRFHWEPIGVRFVGRSAITLAPVGADKFRFVKFPLGRGAVAFVAINWAGVQPAGVLEQGRDPESVIRAPKSGPLALSYVALFRPAKGGFCAN